ncbi:DNA-processing protein DprA [Neobacillus terrae]|uniref:DNA-processing protein DprA n=1 Tax=Neobacillus terrae TaxID=3034837 RepID=UPI00140DB226|nr:DNA-processing protein DprA [Neobacillus terrae]NHM29781.1 DNA-protecting protein DprA [Neobacillus terrae]
MEEFKRRLIHLLHWPGTTWNSVDRLLKKDPKLLTVKYDLPQEYYSSQSTNHSISQQLQKSFSSEILHEQIRQYKTNQIHIITVFDKEYPPMLREIFQPPWALFAKGDLSLLTLEPKLAVVGSRQATQYGKNAIRLMFPGLIKRNVLIVSGLAKGIDTLAHECTIQNDGKTIAVIAGGFYHIYPRENMNLALDMMKNQLIVSEYPPDTKPMRWHFPARNRIISGMSKGTLIIEAKRKSGSLITANYAVNEGRDVFSLPGSIFNPFSCGTNDLIQQGAKLVASAEDILEEIIF